MSIELLDKIGEINKLLRNTPTEKLLIDDVCTVLSDVLESNILLINKKGRILGKSSKENIVTINELPDDSVGSYIDSALNERLLNIMSTIENMDLLKLGFRLKGTDSCNIMICPIFIMGDRLGTLFIYKDNGNYEVDDIILSEYGVTVTGLLMIRIINEENLQDMRKFRIVNSAINALSHCEFEAMIHILEEINGPEGILVVGKVAEKIGVTRSVIVNALRKFESAGIIESRSSGMKGTYIKILDNAIFKEMKKQII